MASVRSDMLVVLSNVWFVTCTVIKTDCPLPLESTYKLPGISTSCFKFFLLSRWGRKPNVVRERIMYIVIQLPSIITIFRWSSLYSQGHSEFVKPPRFVFAVFKNLAGNVAKTLTGTVWGAWWNVSHEREYDGQTDPSTHFTGETPTKIQSLV